MRSINMITTQRPLSRTTNNSFFSFSPTRSKSLSAQKHLEDAPDRLHLKHSFSINVKQILLRGKNTITFTIMKLLYKVCNTFFKIDWDSYVSLSTAVGDAGSWGKSNYEPLSADVM